MPQWDTGKELLAHILPNQMLHAQMHAFKFPISAQKRFSQSSQVKHCAFGYPFPTTSCPQLLQHYEKFVCHGIYDTWCCQEPDVLMRQSR